MMRNANDARNVWQRYVSAMSPAVLRVRQPRTPGQASDSFLLYNLPRCKTQRLNKKDAELVGGLMAADRFRWIEVFQEALDHAQAVAPAVPPCPAPKVGDGLDTEGVSYIVKAIERKLYDTNHKCLCQEAV